jgi:hypothetical protein
MHYNIYQYIDISEYIINTGGKWLLELNFQKRS